MTLFETNLLVVFPAILVAAIVLGEVIRHRVRARHPDAWIGLGRPGPLRFEKFNSFLANGIFHSLGDKGLTQLCSFMIWLRRLFLVWGSIWLFSITYTRPVILAAIVLLMILAGLLNRYARARRKNAV